MLEKLLLILERIAVALEKSVSGHAVPAAPGEKPAAAKPAKTKPAPPPAEPEDDVDFLGEGETAELEEEAKVYTKDEVRAAVVAYQKRTTPTKAQALLKSFGADTLGQLDPSKYAEIIAAAGKK